MEEIFKEATARAELSSLLAPYVSNRTAKMTSEKGVVFSLLAEQIDHSVLWKQSVEHLFTLNCHHAFEFGPGKVLQGLAKRIAKNKEFNFETHPIYDLETLKLAAGVLHS